MITNHVHFSCVSAVPIWLRTRVRLGVLLQYSYTILLVTKHQVMVVCTQLPFRNFIGNGCEYMMVGVCNWPCYLSVVVAGVVGMHVSM